MFQSVVDPGARLGLRPCSRIGMESPGEKMLVLIAVGRTKDWTGKQVWVIFERNEIERGAFFSVRKAFDERYIGTDIKIRSDSREKYRSITPVLRLISADRYFLRASTLSPSPLG